MPNFRYEAKDSQGVPTFGTVNAIDRAEVEARLSSQGQTLVSLTEVSLKSTTVRSSSLQDRLFQLQVGEHLREAVLTDIPAHLAIRSMAKELTQHPSVDICSWAIGITGIVAALLLVLRTVVSFSLTPILILAVVALVLLPLLKYFLRWWSEIRPQLMLNQLADQLESGHELSATIQQQVPEELQPVMRADLKPEQKARVTSEVVSQMAVGDLAKQQLAIRFAGPLLLIATIVIGAYCLFVFIIPMFAQIFRDFDTDLPSLTQLYVDISDSIVGFGRTGLLALCFVCTLTIAAAVIALRSDATIGFLARIPFLGLPFRWLRLSTIAQLFASMIRNDCDYGESAIAATHLSGQAAIRSYGRELAGCLESGSSPPQSPSGLQGLPFSLLFADGQNSDQQHRRGGIAATFENLSQIFRQASLSQAYMLIEVLHATAVIAICSFLGLTIMALFLPLIKLLNDLA